MGMFDNLRNFFKGSNNTSVVKEEDPYKKIALATQIVKSIEQIKKINTFDSSLWNLSNVSSYDLQRKSLAELEKLNSILNNRISELSRQTQASNQRREYLEESKWTGQKPRNLTDKEFDRLQKDEGR